MHGWLQHAQMVPAGGKNEWWRYLAIDESGDLWLYSFTHSGMVRFNPLNPAHWVYYARSRADHTCVRLTFA